MTGSGSAPGVPLANHRCPLCGGPNGCAPAACGRFDVACWCTELRIPSATLARVPEGQRGLACLCAACAGATTGARA